MGDVVKFDPRVRKAALKEKARGRTLCDRGFHDWEVAQQRPFDVKLGKLVTLSRCRRCGATRTSAT